MLQKHYTKQNSTTLNSIELNSAHSGIQRKWPVQDNSQTKKLTGGTGQSPDIWYATSVCLLRTASGIVRSVPFMCWGLFYLTIWPSHKEDLIINIYCRNCGNRMLRCNWKTPFHSLIFQGFQDIMSGRHPKSSTEYSSKDIIEKFL